MGEVLNKCPLCGARLEYNLICQYTEVYTILKNGKISSRRVRKEDNGSMDCGFLSCTNKECDFSTDCDIKVKNNKSDMKIYIIHDAFMYEKGAKIAMPADIQREAY